MIKVTDEELLSEIQLRLESYRIALEEHKKLNAELKVANKKLEEAEALKSHFISNITNEIQNPFTSIVGLAKNILSVKKEDWKTVILMVSHIYAEAFNLEFQFKNIFMAAKLEAGEVDLEVCKLDIRNTIESNVEMYMFEAKKKQVAINSFFDFDADHPEGYFNTDPEKFKLVFSNLISNAIKYSPEKNHINLYISIKDRNLSLIVEDFGPGISPENLTIIFDRFKRVESGINSINRGHGLGLSINKALLDLLEGTINVKTEPGKGSRFTVNLPEREHGDLGFASDDSQLFFDDGNAQMF